LEQNLRGKNGILGKAIMGALLAPDGETIDTGCCIIREDMPPMAETTTESAD